MKEIDAEMIERVYGTPLGWLVRLRGGKLWLWDEGTTSWREWKLQLANVPASSSKGATKSKRPLAPAVLQVVQDSLSFAGDDLFAITNGGFVRCRSGGNCLRLKAFGSTGGARAMCVSANGKALWVIAEGKLGMSTRRRWNCRVERPARCGWGGAVD